MVVNAGRLYLWLVLLGAGFASVGLAALHPSVLPNLQLARAGSVSAMVMQPGGKVIVAGNFLSIRETSRTYLGRLNSDGTPDPDWGTTLNGPVRTLATNETSLFIAGDFSEVASIARRGFAKLRLSDGSLDESWHPALPTNGYVSALAVSGDDVFISGAFTNMGGQPRRNLAKVSASGNGPIDIAWTPAMDGSASVMIVDGIHLYLAGYFYSVGGANRAGLARVSTTGAGVVDASWAPPFSSPPFFVSLQVHSNYLYCLGFSLIRIAVDGNGSSDATWPGAALPSGRMRSFYATSNTIYIGGDTEVVRHNLDTPTMIDPLWRAHVAGSVNAIGTAGTNVYLGGSFDQVDNLVAPGLARVDPQLGRPDRSFAPRIELPGHVFALAAEPAGGVIVGGNFAFAGDVPRRNLARIQPNGLLDPQWNPGVDAPVTKLLIHSNDVFVAGHFNYVGGQSRYRIAKVSLPAGAVDPGWEPDFLHYVGQNTSINAMAAHGTNLFVAGDFIRANEYSRINLAKVSTDGAGDVDPAWNPSPSLCCSWYLARSIALIDGNLFVCGTFESIGGRNQKYLAKLRTSGIGVAYADWNPNPDNYVLALATDGAHLFTSGQFTNIGGLNRGFTAKLDPDTGAASEEWNPPPPYGHHLVVDGTNLYTVRMFVDQNNPDRNYAVFARLSTASGADDPAWQPVANIPPRHLGRGLTWPPSDVYAFAARSGIAYVGGDFTQIEGVARNGLAAFNTPQNYPMLRYPAYSGGYFSCELLVEPGTNYTLQGSADLIDWVDLMSVTSARPVVPVIAPAVSEAGFYRLKIE